MKNKKSKKKQASCSDFLVGLITFPINLAAGLLGIVIFLFMISLAIFLLFALFAFPLILIGLL